jgi:L-rhamnose mutarotase
VGYLESDDFYECLDGMKKSEVNARWQAQMAPFFESAEGGVADDNMFPLAEVFHLD